MTTHEIAHIPCEHVIRSVWDFLDDEIDSDLRERIRHHLALCDHCRDQYTFEGKLLRSIGRLVDGAEAETLALRARIERALIEHGVQRR
jgi:anti-sigma factor (TIGR02949 family)